MSALLSVSDAHVSYGKVEAVRSVSLDVADNEIVTIIGANGAGKTTLLNAIMGVLPLKGATTFAGLDMTPLDIEDRVAAGLCLVPEHRELFGTMNVEDNLQLGAFRIPKATAAKSFERVYTLFPRLKERRKQLAGTLSGGEQQMLAMGRALMGAPMSWSSANSSCPDRQRISPATSASRRAISASSTKARAGSRG